MAKRVLDLSGRELAKISAKDFKSSVVSSEGRTICAEVVVQSPPLVDGVSNVELAASFGADMVLLNMYDVFNPRVEGVPEEYASISDLSEFLQRFVGNNLEPVDPGVIPEGRRLSPRSIEKSIEQGSRLIVVTGNPGLGVTWSRIREGVEASKRIVGERALVFGGKMHSGGIRGEDIYDLKLIEDVLAAGADGVVVPAPYTVPGSLPERVSAVARLVYKYDALLMCAIGTSQEGSSSSVIRKIGLASKACGCDIHHIGDSGYRMGVAVPENILELSVAVRGVRHTYRRVAMSHLR
ncbi:DUF7916 family protein [Thermofilum pendens]|uniref:DUF7916 domain-containing protein n=1 Tax=Thermofilum pendens (strain DSM 2475 / Hrk 5) TaxID=368408 RepID=A1RZ68_THEPD|nr:hypothetical protein [Thermofilum pendens]ABL78498.1 conserved hypothetical protein [Thermofilum pendens Hrk 5]